MGAALRILVILAGLGAAGCAIAYLWTGERRYLTWTIRTLIVSCTVALVFFAVLFVDRLG